MPRPASPGAGQSNRRPDEEGIETALVDAMDHVHENPTADLMKKGLRRLAAGLVRELM